MTNLIMVNSELSPLKEYKVMINYDHSMFLILFGFLNILLSIITFSLLRKMLLAPKPIVVRTRIKRASHSRLQ